MGESMKSSLLNWSEVGAITGANARVSDAPKISVSVVMPTYNGRSHLQPALDSIRQQTMQPVEVIVVDDGSSDGSADIAEQWGAKVIRLAHSGVCEARNTGILAAKGDWIAFIDQDDLWQPTKLERQWQAVQRYPGAVLVVTDCSKVGPTNDVLLPSFVHADFMHYGQTPPDEQHDAMDWFVTGHHGMRGAGSFILPSATIVRRDRLIEAGMFDKRIRLNEDLSCFLRVLTRGGMVLVDQPLTGWRIHATNTHHNDLGMVRGRLAMTRVAFDEPHTYPDWFVQQLRDELPGLYVEIGRKEIEAGNTAFARRALFDGVKAGAGLRALGLWASTFLGAARAERVIAQLRRLR
jgi:cellulose synthase/poly-beta-1,6-N-acetylglucosamine synthase-like glycosyltransferase